MNGAPFLVVPWREDFLQRLVFQALEDTDTDISQATFIFPHIRPQRYLTRILRRERRVRRPLVLPDMHTVSGLFSSLRARILSRPLWNAGLLDRVGLLLACAREERDVAGPDPASPFLADARRFFPWGVRLASLFEECFNQNVRPDNVPYIEDQVSPFAGMLLTRLRQLFARYTAGLEQREWTTPGYDAFLTAQWLREHSSLPSGLFSGGPVYIAGFHILSGAEDVLFRHLWEQCGARVIIHADPSVCENGQSSGAAKAHWSCRAFAQWAAAYGTRLIPADFPKDGTHACPEDGPSPSPCAVSARGADSRTAPLRFLAGRIRYFQGFDLHSQLAALQEELGGRETPPDTSNAASFQEKSARGGIAPRQESDAANPDGAETKTAYEDANPTSEDGGPDKPGQTGGKATPEDDGAADQAGDTVVVLPDSRLLLPVLHHLPPTDINISMGYPLSRSPLFRLVDTVAGLQEKRRETGYYWRDLVDLIRHPYIKMLRPEGDNSAIAPLRRELRRLERALREQGRAYAFPGEILEQAYTLLGPEEMPSASTLALLESLLVRALDGFSGLRTPRALGLALANLCDILRRHGRHLWDRFPIDAECLYRLTQSLIPELAQSQLAEEEFPPQTLFAILRNLLEAERVPFDATPLVGMQVMGMLETRLLSFRRVIVLDAGEETLPGLPAGDPLLPEILRPQLGLPPLHDREQVAAYHFFRLLAGADDILLFWQEGGDAPGIQDKKRKKSRFIEELLWEEEKSRGRLLSSTGRDGPLTVLAGGIAPIHKEQQGIAVGPEERALLRERLRRPLSASLLDSYLQCPLRFYLEKIANLAETASVREGEDPLLVGNLLHQTLHECYARRLGTSLPGGPALADALGEVLTTDFTDNPAFLERARALPADSFAMLALAGKKRLHDFLMQQPPATALALETTLTLPFPAGGEDCALTGKMDRIDLRPLLLPEGEGEAVTSLAASGIVIVDYKTGRPPRTKAALWEDEALWQRLRSWLSANPPADSTGTPIPPQIPRQEGDMPPFSRMPTPDASISESGNSAEADALLNLLADRLDSLQLPLYLFLFRLAAEQGLLPPELAAVSDAPPVQAVWVSLGDTGEETPLFPESYSLEQRLEIVENRIPLLLVFLLRHMRESSRHRPRPGQYCDWCSCAKLCIVMSETKISAC